MSKAGFGRRRLLAALLGVVVLVAAAILADVLGTVFFAITIAYVLVPVEGMLRGRGLHRWWASAIATVVAVLAIVAVFLPIGVILYLRRRPLLDLLGSLPERVTLELVGVVYVVDAGDVIAYATANLSRAAIAVARATPVLAAKVVVFVFVVFALLLRRTELRRALLAPVPSTYHDIALAYHERVRDTLFALYVIQAATAAGTFVVALVVFAALGYRFPIALAVVAGILQFLPVVGPSLVVIGVAAVEASAGAYADAALVLALGLVLVGVVQDAIIRPRLARETADLPASLYFVGFTGGVLSLGPVGIIAGPLVVVLIAETLRLLATEMHQTTLDEFRP